MLASSCPIAEIAVHARCALDLLNSCTLGRVQHHRHRLRTAGADRGPRVPRMAPPGMGRNACDRHHRAQDLQGGGHGHHEDRGRDGSRPPLMKQLV